MAGISEARQASEGADNKAMILALLAQAVYWVYPAPGVIANGPAPVFARAQDAARCEDALWVDDKGLPDKTVSESRYKTARAVCDKAQASLEPGVPVIVEGQFTLKSSSLAAFRLQGLVVRQTITSVGKLYSRGRLLDSR